MGNIPKVAKTASWVETRIHKALVEQREATSREKKDRLALSQIGGCKRDLWASINGIPSERVIQGRILTLFDLGNAVEDHIVRLLILAGFNVQERDPETGEQFRVTHGDRASGRTDGKIELGSRPGNRRWSLLEIKSANTKKFEELLEIDRYEEWNPKYGDQIQIYMGKLKYADALTVVECKNDSRLKVEIVDFDPDRYRELTAKADEITMASEVLDRPPEAKSQYCGFCKYCDRQKWCWGPLVGVRFDE